MEGRGLVISLLLLAALLSLHAEAAAGGLRRSTGRCPRLLKVAPSQTGCKCDDDCPGNHKCCVYNSKSVCLQAAFDKVGKCPDRKWGFGLCAEYCSDDSDCPRNEKCCSNGCGHECTVPYKVKLGRCPAPVATNMCAEFCYHNGECPEEQKCCKTTCGHACTELC
ncbi:WAP four-disulfide core domain protein 3 [Synchiropus picturatus]